jgi:uridine phosphorylase
MTVLPPDRPIHLSATREDFAGNGEKGRYLLLPGSRSRARAIAERFLDSTVKTHPRGHDLHLGRVEKDGQTLDVGTISTGMGCPSIDLIVTELLALGATTLLRVGTCGSLQPEITTGDLIVATAAVRDEGTSDHYLPREFPALASFALLRAADAAAHSTTERVHFGPVHTKDSLYARELKLGPLRRQHEEYEAVLRRGGVLASEMECAHLFVLAQLGARAEGPPATAGAVLAVIGDHDQPFRESPLAGKAVDASIRFAIDTLFELHRRADD